MSKLKAIEKNKLSLVSLASFIEEVSKDTFNSLKSNKELFILINIFIECFKNL